MRFLLDQNVPRSVKIWLKNRLPECTVQHTSELDLYNATDEAIYGWAVRHQAIIITFDYDFIEDFATRHKAGVIHLRANPTNTENATQCLSQLFSVMKPEDCANALVIVKASRIRIFEYP